MSEVIETDVEENGSETQPVETNQPANISESQGKEFIPEAYRDKGYLKNVKNVDDVYKMLDNSQALIGKKTIGIPDFENSSQTEIEEYYGKLRPASADDYDIDLEDEDKALFKEIFYKNGINKQQGKALIEAYKASIDKQTTELFSAEGYIGDMKARFGDGYEEVKNKVNGFLAKEMKTEDLKIIDQLPNNILGLVSSIVNTVMERFAVKDTDIGKFAGNSGAPSKGNFNDYTKEMSDLARRPHTVEDKQAIMKKYGILE